MFIMQNWRSTSSIKLLIPICVPNSSETVSSIGFWISSGIIKILLYLKILSQIQLISYLKFDVSTLKIDLKTLICYMQILSILAIIQQKQLIFSQLYF